MSSETHPAAPVAEQESTTPVQSNSVQAAPQQIENIEEIDFLLEEIESKIAPLALA